MISAKEAVTTRFTVAETAPAAFTSTVSRPEVTLCSSCSQSMPSNRLISQPMSGSWAWR